MVSRSFNRNVCSGIFFLIHLIQYNISNVSSPVCEGNKGCCEGYQLNNETNECEKCQSGYSGPNCSDSCPYPAYGEKCQGYCDCDNETCDVSTGCTTPTTERLSTLETKESTFLNEDRTHFKTDGESTRASDFNRLLILLIEIFGGVDILLIFTYFLVCVHDQIQQRKNKENIPIPIYENTDVVSFSINLF